MIKFIKKYKLIITVLMILIMVLTTVSFIPISASRLIPIIEKQILKEYGVIAHIDKLVLRVGPVIKIKAPIVHLMFKDGNKFAQLNTVKIYLTWPEVMKNTPQPYSISAKSLNVRINSNDKDFNALLLSLKNKNNISIPNILIKDYKLSYLNKENNDKYILSGPELYIAKLVKYKNYRFNSKGNFLINDKQHITYDIVIHQNLNNFVQNEDFDVFNIINQIKELDFQGDIISDLKFYNNTNNVKQTSGFINIDNISVLDKNGKIPKSFLYLTFWGDKAGLLSNIFADENKKIYIEGLLKNSNKPSLDIKIKTDEINLKDIFNKIRIFANLSKYQSIKMLDGNLSANFTLKGDINKLKSNGYLKIKDGYILTKDNIEIKNISSDVDFSNNKTIINNTTGYINNEPIFLKGTIDKLLDLELIMNKVELKYLLPQSWGIQDGIASVVAHISGTFDNIIHKEKVHIENLKINNKNISYNIDSIKFDTNKSNVAFVNNILCKSDYTDTIKLPLLKLFIERDYIKIPETNIFMANSKLVLKSEILNYLNNNLSFSLSLNGFLHSNDIKKINIKKGKYPIKLLLTGNKQIQNTDLQILLENSFIPNESGIINLNSKIEKNIFKIEDLSLLSFNGTFNDNLKSNLKGTKKVIITGNIENFKQPICKNLRIFIPQQLKLNIYDTALHFKGDLFINGPYNKPEFIGQAIVQSISNDKYNLSINSSIVDFNKNNIIINSPLIKLFDSTFGLNATIDSDLKNALNIKNLNIKAKYINLVPLMQLHNQFKDIKSLNILDGKIYTEKLLTEIYEQQLSLTGFSSDISTDNGLFLFKNLTAELYNGNIGGNITFNTTDTSYSANLMIRNTSSSSIFDLITVKKDSISGTMDADLNISGSLSEKDSISGDLKFQIKNGKMNSLGKIEHLLFAQNVIADNMLRTSLNVVLKALSLKDTGLFKYMRGNILLNNGIADIKMIQTVGPHMSLFIKGKYNPNTNYGSLTVLGRITDEIISGLGAFGEFSMKKLMVMLTGDETEYNIIPDDINNLPQLSARNTKEFRSLINGDIDKTSSVVMFNWISYSQKSLKQKEVQTDAASVPAFIEKLPY